MAYPAPEGVTILLEIGMCLYLALALRTRAFSIFATFSLIASKNTLQVLLTTLPGIHPQANATRMFGWHGGKENGEDEVFRDRNTGYLGCTSRFE